MSKWDVILRQVFHAVGMRVFSCGESYTLRSSRLPAITHAKENYLVCKFVLRWGSHHNEGRWLNHVVEILIYFIVISFSSNCSSTSSDWTVRFLPSWQFQTSQRECTYSCKCVKNEFSSTCVLHDQMFAQDDIFPGSSIGQGVRYLHLSSPSSDWKSSEAYVSSVLYILLPNATVASCSGDVSVELTHVEPHCLNCCGASFWLSVETLQSQGSRTRTTFSLNCYDCANGYDSDIHEKGPCTFLLDRDVGQVRHAHPSVCENPGVCLHLISLLCATKLVRSGKLGSNAEGFLFV